MIFRISDITFVISVVACNPNSVCAFTKLCTAVILSKTYSDTDDAELLSHIKKKYAESYNCSQLILKYIRGSYGYDLEDEECMYLTIHIEKVVKDSNKV